MTQCPLEFSISLTLSLSRVSQFRQKTYMVTLLKMEVRANFIRKFKKGNQNYKDFANLMRERWKLLAKEIGPVAWTTCESEKWYVVHMTVLYGRGVGCSALEEKPGASDGESSLPCPGPYAFSCRQWSPFKFLTKRITWLGFHFRNNGQNRWVGNKTLGRQNNWETIVIIQTRDVDGLS